MKRFKDDDVELPAENPDTADREALLPHKKPTHERPSGRSRQEAGAGRPPQLVCWLQSCVRRSSSSMMWHHASAYGCAAVHS